jgi:EGF domain-specific O-GlcNAc transferase
MRAQEYNQDSLGIEAMLWYDEVVVPLPGSSNPLWEGSWQSHHCADSDLAKTFHRRVLDVFGLEKIPQLTEQHALAKDAQAAPWPKTQTWDRQINVTIIDRKETRRIANLTSYVPLIQAAYPNAKITVVDFGSIPFCEQVELAYYSDVLVGVHGAALTHLLFLPTASPTRPTANVIEIQPKGLHHRGFRNVAQMLGHRYFMIEADNELDGADFHDVDVEVGEEKFVDAIGTAIRASLNKGMREGSLG